MNKMLKIQSNDFRQLVFLWWGLALFSLRFSHSIIKWDVDIFEMSTLLLELKEKKNEAR